MAFTRHTQETDFIQQAPHNETHQSIVDNIQMIQDHLRCQFNIGVRCGNWSLFDYHNPTLRRGPRIPFPQEKWSAIAGHIEILEQHLGSLSEVLATYTPEQKHTHRVHKLRRVLDSVIPPAKTYGSLSWDWDNSSLRSHGQVGIPDVLHFIKHLKWHHTQSIRENSLDEKESNSINEQIEHIESHAARITDHLTNIDTVLKQHNQWEKEKEMVQAFIAEYKKQCWLGTGHSHWFFGWALPRSDFGRLVFEHPEQLNWAKIDQYVSDTIASDKSQGKDPAKRASVRTLMTLSGLTTKHRAMLQSDAKNVHFESEDYSSPTTSSSKLSSIGGPHTP